MPGPTIRVEGAPPGMGRPGVGLGPQGPVPPGWMPPPSSSVADPAWSKQRTAAEAAWSSMVSPASRPAEAFLAQQAQSNAAFTAGAVGNVQMPGIVGRTLNSPRVGADAISAGLGGNEALQHLRNIDLSSRTLTGITLQHWNTQQSAMRPAFVPPNTLVPPSPAWLPPGTGALLPTTSPINIPRPPGGWAGGGGGGRGGGGGGRGGGGGGGRGGGGGGRGGGGGGGGGGRGGGTGGGGGGGGFQLPFAGAVGMGSTSKLLTGAFEFGLALKAIEEIAMLPQSISNLEMSALSSAQPYNRLVLGTYGMGRAGGFSGQGLLEGIGGGKMTPPAWMASLGLGPTEAFQLMSGFGIAPTSIQQGTGIAQGLAGLGFQPTLSGIPQGQLNSSAATMARYGLISPDKSGIEGFGQQLNETMSIAVEKGLDRAAILRSIDAAVTSTARGGGTVGDVGAVGSFLTSFSSIPGGRTGEAGLSAMQGLSGALSSVGQNPARTVVMSWWANKLKSEGDLKQLFDSTNGPGSWDKFSAQPGNRTLIDRYLEQRGQNSYFATKTLSDILDSPDAAGVSYRVFSENPVTQQFGKSTAPMVGANLSGLTQRQFDARMTGQIPGMVGNVAISKGLDPAVLQAVAGTESGFDPKAHSPAGAEGLMQIMPGTQAHLGMKPGDQWDPEKSAEGGADYLNEMLRIFGGDMRKALMAYNWGPGKQRLKNGQVIDHTAMINAGQAPQGVQGYADTVLNRASAIRARSSTAQVAPDSVVRVKPSDQSNIPTSVLTGESFARTMGVWGSSVSSAELNKIIPIVNSSLSTLIDATKEYADKLTSAKNQFDGFGGATQWMLPQ